MRIGVPLLAVAVAVLGGCFGKTEKVDCLNFSLPEGYDRDILRLNVELARKTLDEAGFVKAGRFCESFADVHFDVYATVSWAPNGDESTYGYATVPQLDTGGHAVGRIELGHDARSLVHELIHARDFAHGLDSSAHSGWAETGRGAADLKFKVYFTEQ